MNASLKEKLDQRRARRPTLPKKIPLREDQIAAYYGIDEPSYCGSVSHLESTRLEVTEDESTRFTFDKSTMKAFDYSTLINSSSTDDEQSAIIREESIQQQHADVPEEVPQPQELAAIMGTPKSTRRMSRRSSRFTLNELDVFDLNGEEKDSSRVDAEQSGPLPEESNQQHRAPVAEETAQPQELAASPMMETPKSTRQMSRRSCLSIEPMELDVTHTPRRYIFPEPGIARSTMLLPRMRSITPPSSQVSILSNNSSDVYDEPVAYQNSFDAVDEMLAPEQNNLDDAPEDIQDSSIQELPLIKLVAALPSKKEKKTFVLHKPKLIKPESPQPETIQLRRSNRNRVRPLRNDLNERPVYKMDKNGCQTLVGVSTTVVSNGRAQKYMTLDALKQKERENQLKKAKKENKKNKKK